MSLPSELASQKRATAIEVFTALSGSGALDLLGMTAEDLDRAGADSDLFKTLRITHDALFVLRDAGVLTTFLMLQAAEQSDFLRWIAAADGEETRASRTDAFIAALRESPLAD